MGRTLFINGLREHEAPTEPTIPARLGGRRYGTSEDIETLQGKNNPSTGGFGTIDECGSSISRRRQFAGIIGSLGGFLERKNIMPDCLPVVATLQGEISVTFSV
jgi:hypothetical protein